MAINHNLKKLGNLSDLYTSMGDTEGTLLGNPSAGWTQGGTNNSGYRARGDATLDVWVPTDSSLKTSSPWNAVLGWWSLWAGTGHTSTNTGVNIRNIQVWLKSASTGAWSLANIGETDPGWSDASNVRDESDGSKSYFFNGSLDRMHGSAAAKVSITGSDVACVYIRLESRLVLENTGGTDDRLDSEILCAVGGDWWPTTTSVIADFTPMTYNPGIGNSAHEFVLINPRIHQYASIHPPTDNTGYSFVGDRSITRHEFESNLPPPLEPVMLSGKVELSVALNLINSMNLGKAEYPLNYTIKHTLERGFGDDEAVTAIIDEREISASGSEDIDLSGGLNSSFGYATTFTRIKALIVTADDSNTNDVLVGGGTDAFLSIFGDTSDKFRVKPGGSALLVAPKFDGYIVKGNDEDILTVANSGGGTSVFYTILLIGTV